MKLCPKCETNFIKNNRQQCRVCYLKDCIIHKPICKCGKVLSNYNNKLCVKCNAKARGKEIEQMDKKGNHLAFWDSIQSAARLLELRQPDLTKCLQGKRNKVGNFKWKYV